MLAKRVIPCMDIKDGRVVKGTHFKDLVDSGDPLELAKRYSRQGADELVLLDIVATVEERKNRAELVRAVAEAINIPFSVGGGVNTLEHVRELLNAGADKVSIGSAAVANPDFVKQACEEFGSQAIVISIDPKRNLGSNTSFAPTEHSTGEPKAQPVALADSIGAKGVLPLSWEVYIKGGRENTGIDAAIFARQMEQLGVGELLVNSLDKDGTKRGFDIELLKKITDAVNIPVIASSGAGSLDDFVEVFQQTGVTAALGASVFHSSQFTVKEVKSKLKAEGVEVRL